MTQIEERFYSLACRFFAKADDKKDIDWEQRRYEIAKDAITSTLFGGNNGTPNSWINSNPNKYKEMADNAVLMADALIEKLRNKE